MGASQWAIDNAGNVAGWSNRSGESFNQAFVWSPSTGTMTGVGGLWYEVPTIACNQISHGHGMNEVGQVVGQSPAYFDLGGTPYCRTSRWDAFVYTPGGTGGVPHNPAIVNLSEFDTYRNNVALDINDFGVVVGSAYPTMESTTPRARRWANGITTDLNDLLPSGSGWVLEEARAVNNDGAIVGWGLHDGERRAFIMLAGPRWDADGDGLPDATEGTTGDADGDGVPNYLDADSDGDWIPDANETSADPDGDGVPNYLDDDSDNDGRPDAYEGAEDYDDDGIPNYLDLDSDGDGILDAHESVVYVDIDNTGGIEDGTSWTTAFNTVQEGINSAAAGSGSEVWVAEGTYPGSITLASNVQIYGAFAGTEANASERDLAGHETILDGGGEVYHVVVVDTISSVRVDGFTITGGNANGSAGIDDNGGGMYIVSSSPVVANCTFSDNSAFSYGGGMYNWESSPLVTNCTFSGNSASSGGGMGNASSSPLVTNCTFLGNSTTGFRYKNDGGGMYNYSSSPTVANCTFSGNSANSGGGMHNYSSSPIVTNCTFSNNSVNGGGGGMRNASSSPLVTNCTFLGNSADIGAGMGNYLSSPTVTNCTFVANLMASTHGRYYASGMHNSGYCSPTVTNCIFWNNEGPQVMADWSSSPSVTYCNVQGGYTGTGNIDADPVFANPSMGDFRIALASPCVDAGTSTGAPAHDIAGRTRPQGAGVDIGAYEYFSGQDSDNNGIADESEGTDDTDGDGILDMVDRDDDGDGLLVTVL